MSLTKYPNGISSMGMPIIGGNYITTGDVYFADSSTGSNGNTGADKSHAFGSVDYSIGKCTASKDDHIFVMPGYSETLTGAAAMVFDIQGVNVVGLGRGSDRPTFLLDAGTTVDIDVTAANVSIKNCLFQAGHGDIVKGFDLSATGFMLDHCEFADFAGNENFVAYILTSAVANACDDLTIIACKAVSPDTGADTHFIKAMEDIDGLTVCNSFLSLGAKNDKAIIHAADGKDFTNCEIMFNTFLRLNASEATAPSAMYSNQTANSGMIAYNMVGNADGDAAKSFDVTGARLVENYSSRAADLNGTIIPAIT